MRFLEALWFRAPTLLLGIVIGGLLLLVYCSSCSAPQGEETGFTRLARSWSEKSADGVLTAEELAAFRAELQAEGARERDNPAPLVELLATGLGSVLASFLGVNLYRNRTRAAALEETAAKVRAGV